MDSRRQRFAKNEALFRKVNERIQEINEERGDAAQAEFLCECGDDNCTEPVLLTQAEYEEIRRHPARFVVARGHDAGDVETVLYENDRFAVVEKDEGEPERIAVETDPRS